MRPSSCLNGCLRFRMYIRINIRKTKEIDEEDMMKSKHSKALALLTVLVLLLASLLVTNYPVSADQVPGSPEDMQVPKEEDREQANPVNASEEQGNTLRSDANYGVILGASDLKDTTFDELAFSYYEPGF